MNATIKLNDAQRKALAAFVARCANDGLPGRECLGIPKGVRKATVDALVRFGLLTRKWHTVGRFMTFQVVDANEVL